MEATESRAIARSANAPKPVRKKYDLGAVPIFASTITHRIFLSEDEKFWIEIKEELNFGEQTILDNAAVMGILREGGDGTGEAGSMVRLDLAKARLLLCALWLAAWSIPPGEDGKPIRLPRHVNDRITTIKNLQPKWGNAIVEIITDHVAERTEEDDAAQLLANQRAMIPAGEEDRDGPPEHTPNGEFDAIVG